MYGGQATLGANTFTGAQDIGGAVLVGDAANILALRNGGTNLSPVPQTFRIYNYYTDASNYERAGITWSSNVAVFDGGTAAGTGTARGASFGSGASVMQVEVTGSAGSFDWHRNGTSGNTLAAFTGTSLTSTAQLFVRMTPTINQASGTYTVLDINPTETAIGAGPHYLIRGRIGAGSNVFAVDSSGAIVSASYGNFGATSYLAFSGNNVIRSRSSGVMTFSNFAEGDFNRLQFGGTTNLFPAIARSGTTLKFRTADDLADAPITAAAATFTGALTVPGVTTAALTSTGTFTSGAAAQVGTLTNAPAAGNPTTWIKIIDNGTTRYIPAW